MSKKKLQVIISESQLYNLLKNEETINELIRPHAIDRIKQRILKQYDLYLYLGRNYSPHRNINNFKKLAKAIKYDGDLRLVTKYLHENKSPVPEFPDCYKIGTFLLDPKSFNDIDNVLKFIQDDFKFEKYYRRIIENRKEIKVVLHEFKELWQPARLIRLIGSQVEINSEILEFVKLFIASGVMKNNDFHFYVGTNPKHESVLPKTNDEKIEEEKLPSIGDYFIMHVEIINGTPTGITIHLERSNENENKYSPESMYNITSFLDYIKNPETFNKNKYYQRVNLPKETLSYEVMLDDTNILLSQIDGDIQNKNNPNNIDKLISYLNKISENENLSQLHNKIKNLFTKQFYNLKQKEYSTDNKLKNLIDSSLLFKNNLDDIIFDCFDYLTDNFENKPITDFYTAIYNKLLSINDKLYKKING